jgi:hypothetical protein
MNDTELDDLLDSWKAPEAGESLRRSVKSGFHGRVERKKRRWMVGLVPAFLGVAALLLVVTRAAPQTVKLNGHPYTVVSEFVRYAEDGSASVDMYGTSYNDKYGREILLARHLPDHPFSDLMARMLDAANRISGPIRIHLLAHSAGGAEIMAKRAAAGPLPIVSTDCVGDECLSVAYFVLPKAAGNPAIGCTDGPVVDRETILGYATVAIQLPVDGTRMRRTVWMAPALGCFAMKIATEREMANGRFRLVSGKQAVTVRLNP